MIESIVLSPVAHFLLRPLLGAWVICLCNRLVFWRVSEAGGTCILFLYFQNVSHNVTQDVLGTTLSQKFWYLKVRRLMDAEKFLREKRSRTVSVIYCCVTNCPTLRCLKPHLLAPDSVSRQFRLDLTGQFFCCPTWLACGAISANRSARWMGPHVSSA